SCRPSSIRGRRGCACLSSRPSRRSTCPSTDVRTARSPAARRPRAQAVRRSDRAMALNILLRDVCRVHTTVTTLHAEPAENSISRISAVSAISALIVATITESKCPSHSSPLTLYRLEMNCHIKLGFETLRRTHEESAVDARRRSIPVRVADRVRVGGAGRRGGPYGARRGEGGRGGLERQEPDTQGAEGSRNEREQAL